MDCLKENLDCQEIFLIHIVFLVVIFNNMLIQKLAFLSPQDVVSKYIIIDYLTYIIGVTKIFRQSSQKKDI